MKFKIIKESLAYNGSQIEPMWALKALNIKGSSFIAWIGPMDIIEDELIDYEDVGLQIKADEMLHFIIEHFDSQPADLKLCYHRQRLVVHIFRELLLDMGVESYKDGDDLYLGGGKLSVSIATCSASSMKIHFGVNIKNEGTPDNVKTACLMDFINGLSYEDIYIMVEKVFEVYETEITSIEEDITKTRVF
jgi:uncharacterized protein